MNDLFTLPGELNIYTASETRSALAEWFKSQSQADVVRVSGAAVHEVDGAGLQLLLALSSSCRAQGNRWELLDASAVLHKACAMLGSNLSFLPAETAKVTP